jgi:hypothetical protein
MRISRCTASVFGLLAAISFAGVTLDAATATGQGRGHAKKSAKAEQKRDKTDQKADAKHDKSGAIAVDREGHIRIIREYGRGGSLPPGLAKREALPPGLRAQLRERGALPPGLQKHLVLVPVSLGRRLPPVPSYYRRYFAGDDFLVVDTRTNQIVAIIRDVWR